MTILICDECKDMTTHVVCLSDITEIARKKLGLYAYTATLPLELMKSRWCSGC